MIEDMKVSVFRSPTELSTMYGVTMLDRLLGSDDFAYSILHTIAEKVAEKYVEEHYAELTAKLDQNAIANLAIAEASKKIAEEIERRPTILHETKHHTAVYQRGLL